MKTLKKRRKENKTDYLKRIGLLKSNSPRIVFRKTDRYVITQYVTSKEAQDRIEEGVTSKNLFEYGWPKEFKGSLKSIPACYLTGLLIGRRILKNKMEKPIADSGMSRTVHKNRFFAFLRGLKDSGIKIECEEQFFPAEDRIMGKHLKGDFSKIFGEIKSKIQKI